MGTLLPADARTAYLLQLERQFAHVDVRIVLQMQRMIEPTLDQIFVPLDVEVHSSEPSGLDFTLLVEGADQKRSAASEFRNRRASISAAIPFVEALRSQRNLVVLGDPGSGKSTLAKWLIHHLARRQLRKPCPTNADGQTCELYQSEMFEDLLPVPVTLRYFASELAVFSGRPEDALRWFLSDTAWRLDFPEDSVAIGEMILAALDEDRCLFIFDGLDEAIAAERRRQVATAIGGLRRGPGVSRCVVTSREIGYELAPLPADFSVAHVRPYTSAQTRDYIYRWSLLIERQEAGTEQSTNERYVNHRARTRTAEIIGRLGLPVESRSTSQGATDNVKQGLSALASNPLFCTLIGLVHHQGRKLPEDRAELFRLCIEAFVYDWEIQKRVDQVERDSLDKFETLDVLEELAFQFHSGSGRNIASEEELRRIVAHFLTAAKGYHPEVAGERATRLVDLIARRAGLIIARGEGVLGFGHLQFQEYLAGRALVRDPQSIASLLAERIYVLRWQEPIVLAAAHLAAFNERQGTAFIEQILQVPVPEPAWEKLFHHRFCVAWRAAADAVRVSYRLLEQLDQYLAEVVTDPLRLYLLRQLSPNPKLEARATLAVLAAHARSGDDHVRYDVAALVVFPFGAAATDIVLLLCNEDSWVRWPAIRSLARLGTEKSVERLQSFTNDKNQTTRTEALAGLAPVAGISILPAVYTFITERFDDFAIKQVVRALDVQTRREALPRVVQLAATANSKVRANAAAALGGLQQNEAVVPLLQLTHDGSPEVVQAAVSALGEFRHPDALSRLREIARKLSTDSEASQRVRAHAINALANLADQEIAPKLFDWIENTSGRVRDAAIRALGKLKVDGALPYILNLPHDEATDQAAAEALGDLGDAQALPWLIKLAQDNRQNVNWTAFNALGKIGHADAILPLLSEVKNRERRGRSSPASALMHCEPPPSDSAAFLLLRKLLIDRNRADVWSLLDATARKWLIR